MDAGSPPTPQDIEVQARNLLARDCAADAVSLALSHDLEDLAAELLAAGWIGMVCAAAEFDAFFDAVERIGAERFQRWPELEAASVFALTLQMRLRVAAMRLDELEQRVPALLKHKRSFLVPHQRAPYDRADPASGMRSWIGMMRVMQAAFGGRSKVALQLGLIWRADFPRAPDYEVACVHVSEALALVMLDRLHEGEREALAALAIYRRDRIELGMVWATVCASCAQAVGGRLASAESLLNTTLADVTPRLARAPQTLAALRTAQNYLAFEKGRFEQALTESLARIEGREPASALPVMLLLDINVAARSLMALGRADEALALFSRSDLEQPVGDLTWWNRNFALERALVAVVTGCPDAGVFKGPLEVRAIMALMSLVRHRPSMMMLPPLRSLVRQSEGQQLDEKLQLALFMKARVEHDTGNTLLARRSVTQLLITPRLRERLGSLASLAPALQPMFHEALQALLQDPAQRSERLLRLAEITGLREPLTDPAETLPAIALSVRESQIAAALLDGLSNRQIAQRLHLGEQTVRWYLWKLFQKLGVDNRLGAAQALGRRAASAPPAISS